MLIEPIQDALSRNHLALARVQVRVVASELGERSIVLGAATQVPASASRDSDLFNSAVDDAVRVFSAVA